MPPQPVIPISAADSSSWTRSLHSSGNPPRPLGNLSNAVCALRCAPEWEGAVADDTFSYRTVLRRPAPWGGSIGDSWTDNHDRLLAVWLQDRGINVSPALAAEAVQTVACDNPYDPLAEYLDSLEWDGTPRAGSWLHDYLGVQDTEYSRAVGQAWLISAIARGFEPGCKADSCLIIEGPQGRGKSTALKTLASPAWFTDYLSENLSTKDAAILCRGVWIVEFSELEGVMHSSTRLETVKSFLSRTEDRYRGVFGRRAGRFPRQCVFAATTNRDTYMPDETGNRRFWPVKSTWINVQALARDRDQLWAEAVTLYRAGTPWWLNPDQEAEARYEQRARYDADPWDEVIQAWLGKRPNVSVNEILEDCIKKSPGEYTKSDQMRVSRCLKHLGWERYGTPGKNLRRYRP